MWDSNPACEWDGEEGRWDVGCWLPFTPFAAHPVLGSIPASQVSVWEGGPVLAWSFA